MRVYNTDSVDRQRRVDFWSALSSNSITPMSISADLKAPFEGRLWVDRLGPIGLARAYSSGVVIRRTGQRHGAGERDFVLTVSEGASYTALAKGRQQFVRGGDLRLSDTSEVMELTHSGCTVIVLCIKEHTFKKYLPMADELVGSVVSGDRGAGLHASTMIRSLPAGMRYGFVDRATEHLSAALLHSIAAAYSQAYALPDAAPITAGSRRIAIKRFVDSNLGDADLTVQKVAATFDLSDRYLRMLFESDDESLATYIQRRRLEESARQLRDPHCDARSISEIAFAWGFNSLGSFDRAFRAQFDMTPGQYRRR
jgi:AraC family transcriptional regulator, positive regulator of tynA and feaB